jgi:alkanesulfonate monooxygenase
MLNGNGSAQPEAGRGSATGAVELFTTCPPLSEPDGGDYLSRVREVARWSEEAGCAGMLVYTDNALLDAWLLAQTIVQSTAALTPMVAVQPIYMPPYAAARMVASIGYLHSRRLAVNLVTGGSATHLTALGDTVAHDTRYDRITEYAEAMRMLWASRSPAFFDGDFYSLRGARLPCALPATLEPRLYLSGSSDAACRTADRLGVTRLTYPLPPRAYDRPASGTPEPWGIRIGVIARPDRETAWDVARSRFPLDKAAEKVHRMTARITDSRWFGDLSDPDLHHREEPYWLYPFRTYKTFCPYLVGSYQEVADLLRHYFSGGVRTIVLDVPAEAADLRHTLVALETAGLIRARLSSPT